MPLNTAVVHGRRSYNSISIISSMIFYDESAAAVVGIAIPHPDSSDDEKN
jgi:hypothetical protein